jgi:hypothetical protein
MKEKPARLEKLMWKAFSWFMNQPRLYAFATRFTPWALALHPLVKATPLDPVQSWTKTRNFPEAPPKSFRQLWKERAK